MIRSWNVQRNLRVYNMLMILLSTYHEYRKYLRTIFMFLEIYTCRYEWSAGERNCHPKQVFPHLEYNRYFRTISTFLGKHTCRYLWYVGDYNSHIAQHITSVTPVICWLRFYYSLQTSHSSSLTITTLGFVKLRAFFILTFGVNRTLSPLRCSFVKLSLDGIPTDESLRWNEPRSPRRTQ